MNRVFLIQFDKYLPGMDNCPKKVFIVEDNPYILELVNYLVSKLGFDVSACENVTDFNKLLKLNHPDLIILDIMLPDGNGLEVCEHLKTHSETSEIPIILMSAFTDIENQVKKSLANDFISKPFDISDFTRRVQIQMAS